MKGCGGVFVRVGVGKALFADMHFFKVQMVGMTVGYKAGIYVMSVKAARYCVHIGVGTEVQKEFIIHQSLRAGSQVFAACFSRSFADIAFAEKTGKALGGSGAQVFNFHFATSVSIRSLEGFCELL
jgi:hypothetical protein